jgi:O-acetyl-ADP-ribose deacetylase (regulator of RNase III)
MMQLHLRDRNPVVVNAWQTAFAGCGVKISRGDIFDGFPAGAVVSPANSKGDMTGGIDLVYVQRWPEIQQLVYTAIAELPHPPSVGDCIAVSTGDADCPWLFVAPTMSVPMPVPNTANAFLALSAVLRLAREMEVLSVLCPGLCTWSGEMPAAVSAWQMRAAWEAMDMDLPHQPARDAA